MISRFIQTIETKKARNFIRHNVKNTSVSRFTSKYSTFTVHCTIILWFDSIAITNSAMRKY